MTNRLADPYRDTDVIDSRAPRFNQSFIAIGSLLALVSVVCAQQMKALGLVEYAFVVRCNEDTARKVSRHAGPFENVLEHRFSGNGDESFSGETRRGKPGRNYAQNSRWHDRSYHFQTHDDRSISERSW